MAQRGRRAVRARAWRAARQTVQALALALFVGLLVYANAQRPHRLWADLFSRLDPLLMLTASLAGRALLGGLLLAGGVLLATLLLGRVWCGWVCPLGTLLDWLAPRRRRDPAPPEGWRAAKYWLLLVLLGAALLGNQSLALLDPITIAGRTFSAAAWPALRAIVMAVESSLYRVPILWGPLDVVHNAAVQPLFSEAQPVFGAGVWVALLFVAVVALNWRAQRFWCRTLCPLGGLLGLVSRFALLRREVTAACAGCARCERACPTGTISAGDGYRSDPAECTVCLDCLAPCPDAGTRFRWQIPRWRPARRQAYDPGRRSVLTAAGAALAGVALAQVDPAVRRQPATLIRPPGAEPRTLSARCARCGACVRACPTQGLQLSLFEGGVHNLMTPRLEPRLGPCTYGCAACGQVCPTGAIPALPLEQKQHTPIGLARIDRDRCLPWAYNVPCIVCEETCPVPDKAIELEEVQVVDSRGESASLQRPRIVKELCIGCGVCEFKCPMGGEAAVRVFAPTAAGGTPGAPAG